jgi:hypothetical protein
VTRPEELGARGRRLRAALAAVLVRDNAPEVWLVREWLDNWSGIGLIIAGMTHQGWDVQLTAYAARDWRATFFPVGIAHSIVGGTTWEPTRGERCSGQRRRRSTTGTDDEAARSGSSVACRVAPRVGRRGVGPERVGALAANWQFFPSARHLQH